VVLTLLLGSAAAQAERLTLSDAEIIEDCYIVVLEADVTDEAVRNSIEEGVGSPNFLLCSREP